MTHNPVGAGWQPWKDIDFHYVYWWTNFLSCLSLSLPWQPESEAEVGAGGEGTSGAAVKRGLSLEAAAAAAAAAATGQDVKRFRTATGAASTVSSVYQYSGGRRMWLLASMASHFSQAWLYNSALYIVYYNCWILLPTLCWLSLFHTTQRDVFTSVWNKN